MIFIHKLKKLFFQTFSRQNSVYNLKVICTSGNKEIKDNFFQCQKLELQKNVKQAFKQNIVQGKILSKSEFF
jgi:hypothetical protein